MSERTKGRGAPSPHSPRPLPANPALAPSILSADFARLGEEIAAVTEGGAGLLHLDVMDGHFVPNLTIGPPVVASIRRVTALPLDVHLMIAEPDRYIERFIEAGADALSVHQETVPHLNRTVNLIKEHGAAAGVALNPATPLAMLDDILPDLDYVLLMSVNPGFGGQRFIPSVVSKVKALTARLRDRGLQTRIEVDGGIGAATLPLLLEAGATLFVAGSAVFDGGQARARAAELTALIGRGPAR